MQILPATSRSKIVERKFAGQTKLMEKSSTTDCDVLNSVAWPFGEMLSMKIVPTDRVAEKKIGIEQ